MALDVRLATDDDLDQWNRFVDKSPHGTPFHTLEALDVLADHADADLYRYVGYKGQERVGVFPVFLRHRGPVTMAFSPPPGLKVTYLGPVIADNQTKTRRKERQNRHFVQAVLDDVEAEHGPLYYHVKPAAQYPDSRPFVWNGFESTVSHTYHVDLTTDRDDLFDAFSSDARRSVRDCRDADCEVREGDADTVRWFLPRLAALHDDRDAAFDITADFVVDLWESMPEDAAYVYEARVDGDIAGGWVLLESGDTAYYWQAFATREVDVGVNDYAVWTMMQDAMDRGVETFDLVGANKLNLAKYKSKFAPDLVTHEALERGSYPMRFAANVYQWMK
ncbi:lipid II:glycine glycyltransferase FemX [Halobacterium zhouii]|uniref:lipid II:glycine glycyltransferase FemX n=1 Tax=Halobacterium zhouii TaxID=2902624 RepID=UPI001E292A65|nr:GNAT family N-acetyltransferase [Halobacterium zhouii]